jgi:hypothetical protein
VGAAQAAKLSPQCRDTKSPASAGLFFCLTKTTEGLLRRKLPTRAGIAGRTGRIAMRASGWMLTLALLAGGASAREAGDRVLARWAADGMWYPARVSAVQGREVDVAYDDGDVAVVDAADVRAIDWRPGSRLQCNWKNQGAYYWGKVAAMSGEQITFHYDDGYAETMTISRCRSMPAVE